jgi:hypothetical protein
MKKRETIKEALIYLYRVTSPRWIPTVIRVEPVPAFTGLQSDESLRRLNIVLKIGRVKNVNKNIVVEKAIQELECELLL